MTKTFIAVSIKGKEYMFDYSRMIAVPTSSAKRIADALNSKKYNIKNEMETWFPHDNDSYFNDFISVEIKRFNRNRISLCRYYG